MQRAIPATKRLDPRLEGGLFVLSAVVLTLEVLQTKIFAFSLDPVTIFIAIGVCLLGLGASGTVVALLPPLDAVRARRLAALSAAAGAAALLPAHLAFAGASDRVFGGGWEAVGTLVAVTTPYFALGTAITLLLVTGTGAIGRTYAINLAGSGLGCLAVFPLLERLGAERLLVVLFAASLVGALLIASLRARAVAGALVATAALSAWAWVAAPARLVFQPEPIGQVRLLQRRIEMERAQHPGETLRLTPVLSRWDPTARIDVYRFETSVASLQSRFDGPIDTLFFAQDASAGSFLVGVGDDLGRARSLFERTLYGAGYVVAPVRDALIIGLGGAPDVLTALYHRVGHVDAVDINRTTIEIARREFRDFLGDPYGHPGVTVHQMDGRTFIRQTAAQYDLVQMSGVDTKSAYAAGSLSVNENYMYTREAMDDLLARLRPDGVLAILRVGNDVHRLATIAVEGLADLGVEAPERHLFSLSQGLFSVLLVKRSPFTAGDLDRLHDWAARGTTPPDIVMPTHEWIGLSFRFPLRVLYSPVPRPVAVDTYFQALAGRRLPAFLAASPIDLSAPVDDRPFFFLYVKPSALLHVAPPWLAPLYRFVAQLLGLAAVLTLIPLLVLRRRGLATAGAFRTLVYFACLGAGFMLTEIGLIQRFVLLLGHQSYAVSVVLFGLLLGAGAGSALSTRLPATSRRPVRLVMAGLIVLLLLYVAGLGALFHVAGGAGFAVRLGLALALLVTLGLFLGVPFPTGLRALGATGPGLVAWGIGINAFASVLGATAAVPIAMIAGLRVVFLLGAGLYLLALVTVPSGAVAPAAAE